MHETAKNLERGLGPEYISFRNGFAYVDSHNIIQIANTVFGFNGWNTEIRNSSVDYEECKNGRYQIGVKCVIRVTLTKYQNFHEDVGYGSSANMSNRSQAYDKAHKEAVTDAMKRALRQFGDTLGNCIYDKKFVETIRLMKADPRPFDPDRLLRPNTLKRGFIEGETNFNANLEPVKLEKRGPIVAPPSKPSEMPSDHKPVVYESPRKRHKNNLEQQKKEREDRLREKEERFLGSSDVE